MRQVRTLCYHKVSDNLVDHNNTHVSVANFADQMEWLKKNYDIVSLENYDAAIRKDGKDAVAISFDDGYADVYKNALPILKEYRIPATVFITTGNVDTPYSNFMERLIEATLTPNVFNETFELSDDFIKCKWDTGKLADRIEFYRSLGQLFRHLEPGHRKKYEQKLYKWAGIENYSDESKRVLNSDEIRALSQSEYITIGSHTVNHVSLKWVSEKTTRIEIEESKEFLEKIIGRSVELFAYPWGSDDDYSDESINLIKKAGYKYAFTTSNIRLDNNYDPYRLPRRVVNNYDIESFIGYFNKVDSSRTILGERCEDKEKRDINHRIIFIGNIEDDYIVNEAHRVLVWGYGENGRNIYDRLLLKGFGKKLIGFGDNDRNKQSIPIDIGRIMALQDVIKFQKDDPGLHILVCGIHGWEVCFGLIRQGLDNIHVLI